MKNIMVIIILSAFLFSGCGELDDMVTIEDDRDEIQSLKLDELRNNCKLLCLGNDIEENINAESILEDISITNDAKYNDYTEMDVLIDADQREILEKAAENSKNSGIEVIERYDTRVPDIIEWNIIYDRYNIAFDYIIVTDSQINIRQRPSISSPVTGKANNFEKMNVIAKVKGQYIDNFDSDIWYEVVWMDLGKLKSGYILSSFIDVKTFQFDKMSQVLMELKQSVDNGLTAYIANYRDRNGAAPQYNGQDIDSYEVQRYQSAPAYTIASENSSFRYISDGMLVTVTGNKEGFYKIKTMNFEGEYYVPEKYVSFCNSIEDLRKVVIVDRKNQNEAVFQYFKNCWQIVSYTYATTGGNEDYLKPTMLGYFMAIQKREKFEYTGGAEDTAGYAPYAIRFSGGSYINGIPVEYPDNDDKLTDPGLMEYLFTLGTFPRSYGCVRNYTSHAKFLYEWLETGKSAIVIIE